MGSSAAISDGDTSTIRSRTHVSRAKSCDSRRGPRLKVRRSRKSQAPPSRPTVRATDLDRAPGLGGTPPGIPQNPRPSQAIRTRAPDDDRSSSRGRDRSKRLPARLSPHHPGAGASNRSRGRSALRLMFKLWDHRPTVKLHGHRVVAIHPHAVGQMVHGQPFDDATWSAHPTWPTPVIIIRRPRTRSRWSSRSRSRSKRRVSGMKIGVRHDAAAARASAAGHCRWRRWVWISVEHVRFFRPRPGPGARLWFLRGSGSLGCGLSPVTLLDRSRQADAVGAECRSLVRRRSHLGADPGENRFQLDPASTPVPPPRPPDLANDVPSESPPRRRAAMRRPRRAPVASG